MRPSGATCPGSAFAEPAASERITVRHLLTHRSGIPEAAAMEGIAAEHPLTLEGRVRALRTVRLVSPPGAAFHYANADYLALALVIESISGQSYDAYVRTHILAPLDMRDTALSDVVNTQMHIATGYRYRRGATRGRSAVPARPCPGRLHPRQRRGPRALPDRPVERGALGGATVLSAAGIAAMQHPEAHLVPTIGYGTGWWVGPYNGSPPRQRRFTTAAPRRSWTYMLGIPEEGAGGGPAAEREQRPLPRQPEPNPRRRRRPPQPGVRSLRRASTS